VPTTSGRYELLDRIAKGGMAELFRARAVGEQGFAKLLAIKRILPEWANDPVFVQMLIDEARMAANLSHPNIVQVYELGRDEEGWFIAMELVTGPNLAALLRKLEDAGRRMPVACALDIAIQLLEALDYAHKTTDAQGHPLHLIHRDVSPENLLLTTTGTVKLADFGVAKAKNRLHKTQVGALKGKLPYMSPEQVRGEEIDARSDIFAAGLVLWECLAGRIRFDAGDEYSLMEQVSGNRAPSLKELGVQVPAELEQTLARALADSPADRPASAGELAQELVRFHRRAFPDYVPAVLGDLVAESFRAELDRLAAKLQKLQSGADAPMGFAGGAVAAEARVSTGPAKPVCRPRKVPAVEVEHERPTAPVTRLLPDAGRAGEVAAIDAAIRTAEREEKASAKPAKGVGMPMLIAAFALAVGIGVGAVALLDRAGGNAKTVAADAADGSVGNEAEVAEQRAAEAAAAQKPAARSTGTAEPVPKNAQTKKAPSADSGLMGLLDVYCKPDCEVVEGDKTLGLSPLRGLALPVGRHRLTVRNRMLNLQKPLVVDIQPGATTVRSVNLVLR
jgi:serine/threonine protein kinase